MPPGGCLKETCPDLGTDPIECTFDSCGPRFGGRECHCGEIPDADPDVCQCGPGIVMGRPFVVGGHVRHAGIISSGGGDWAVAANPILPATDEDRAALGAHWMKAALAEHASVASFSQHSLELLACGAPAHLVEAAHQAARDEVEHAKMAFGLASAYLDIEVRPSALNTTTMEHTSSIAMLASSVLRDGCIAETTAAMEAALAAASCNDPVVQLVLLQTAKDEARHASLAWDTLQWALHSDREAVHQLLEAPLPAVAVSQTDHEVPDLPSFCVSPMTRHLAIQMARESVIGPAIKTLLAGGMTDIATQIAAAAAAHAPSMSPDMCLEHKPANATTV
eukprot:CAMPEP_0119325808 /NCGR_PEP_ID=MMETSP1333-20130426/66736_1 /TAXON_ID=418940 /ORGANISM="Scyphosphaera apsteinii, Strain RCC1455" /LENGTH=335 /DNA_ID=CAMNT_0007333913 /DNA_START=296 /DNA_END=1303 /DNA_ORIENTATION=-